MNQKQSKNMFLFFFIYVRLVFFSFLFIMTKANNQLVDHFHLD
jgi:hypothetical protein